MRIVSSCGFLVPPILADFGDFVGRMSTVFGHPHDPLAYAKRKKGLSHTWD